MLYDYKQVKIQNQLVVKRLHIDLQPFHIDTCCFYFTVQNWTYVSTIYVAAFRIHVVKWRYFFRGDWQGVTQLRE
jgi:hypothetical protein